MKIKIVLIIAAILAIVLVVTYAFIVRDTTRTVEMENQSLATEIQSTESQRAQLRQEIQDLRQMVAAIPPDFLAEFEDPEAGFMEFLNYINNPIMDELDVNISMQEGPAYTSSPIPHYRSQFSFSFPYVDTREAERFMNFMMHQEHFPLKLSTLNMSGSGADTVKTDVNVSLHIPARNVESLAAIQRELK
ncbi:MAG: hypothetical protein ACLFP9_09565 [Desulfonatronovibrio sp.]